MGVAKVNCTDRKSSIVKAGDRLKLTSDSVQIQVGPRKIVLDQKRSEEMICEPAYSVSRHTWPQRVRNFSILDNRSLIYKN